jgi:hypothetical protein
LSPPDRDLFADLELVDEGAGVPVVLSHRVVVRAGREPGLGHARSPGPPEPLTCERLGAITAPTLALDAEDGMPYSRPIMERLVTCVPGCRLVVLPASRTA